MSQNNQNLKQQTKKGLYWQFLRQFYGVGIQFIIGIFMARLLSPEDYGITALPAVFMAIAGIFISGGFSDALVRKTEVTEYDLSTAFYYSLCVGIVSYLLVFFSSPYIAQFYETPVLEPLMRVTALTFLFSPLVTPQNVILDRRIDFKNPAKISMVNGILTGFIGVLLAYLGYGVWALVLSGLFGNIFNLVMNWYVVRWYPKTGWSRESFSYLWNYGNKLVASYLLDTIYNNITPLFIGKYYSTSELGVYNRAQNYTNLPSQQLTGTIQIVSFPIISKIKDDDAKLRDVYRRMIKLSAFVVFPVMMMLAALARPIILLMITEKWAASIILLQILCFSKMWFPVHALNLNLLRVKGRSDLFLKLEIWKKILGFVILVATLPLGIIVFCCGSVFGSLISLIINTWYTGKLINCGFVSQMKDMSHTFILSVLMFLLVFGLTYCISSLWFQVIVGGTIGALAYIGSAFLLKLPEIDDMKYMLKLKKEQ